MVRDVLLEKFTEKYLNSQTQNEIMFNWKCGEALLCPICCKKTYNYSKKYDRGRQIEYVLQTNGTIHNDA